MIWLAVLIIVVGAFIAFLIILCGTWMMRIMDEAETRKKRIADLEARFARLSEMRIQAHLLFEGAMHRRDVALQHDEIEALNEMRAACEVLLAGLHEESSILERYFQNLIAVLDFVLGGHDGKSGFSEVLKAALSDLDRSQAAEHSTHPLALMERRLATGRHATGL